MKKTTAFSLDLVAISVFAVLARMAHQSDEMPFNFMGFLSTLWPFVIGVGAGWLIAELTKIAKGRAVVIWLVTVIVGLTIWGMRNSAFPHWSFIIVASVMSALLMFGWRGIASLIARKK
ncbi:DUF3054 domain-containing protein [Corynebacterium breve]|uniref:DUF3054 domain-containing protein n=1 Tax=Corynebacterium breve TaxID=3049799 RepID=A0ABY8VEG9_9CORY|nr:DUF3054 domain-containing protein [Corynebacterium breve]WIM67502.1 DUF3054 domain-containing protein [Corynebacterium breve]